MLWQVIVIFANSIIVCAIGLAYLGLSPIFTTNYVTGAGALLFGGLGIYLSAKWYRLAKQTKKIDAPDEF